METHFEIPPRLSLVLTLVFVPAFIGTGYLFWRIASLPAGLEYELMYQTVGSMFISGGVLLSLSRIPEHAKKKTVYKWIEYLTILPIWFGFVLAFLWISLGPGSREFEFGLSAGGRAATAPLFPIIGRIIFGLAALFVGKGAVAYAVRRPMEVLGFRPEETQDSEEVGATK